MPRELVPIRICIRRKRNGDGNIVNDYPDFNKIPDGVRGSLDWSHAIDHYGIGMHYSHDGFGQGDDQHSQICATCVPVDFASAAVAMFPERVSFMSESEWQKFYDDDAHSHELEQTHDTQTLQALAAKKALGIELTASDLNSINPEHPAIGITKNRTRFWKDAAVHHGVVLKTVQDITMKVAPGPSEELPSCC